MCKWGTNKTLLVPVTPTDWQNREVDSCIADIVDALNKGGVLTLACCCGHGKSDGSILLHDGREMVLRATAHWVIRVSNWGTFYALGTEAQAEEWRAHKANWEHGIAEKRRATAEEITMNEFTLL